MNEHLIIALVINETALWGLFALAIILKVIISNVTFITKLVKSDLVPSEKAQSCNL